MPAERKALPDLPTGIYMASLPYSQQVTMKITQLERLYAPI